MGVNGPMPNTLFKSPLTFRKLSQFLQKFLIQAPQMFQLTEHYLT